MSARIQVESRLLRHAAGVAVAFAVGCAGPDGMEPKGYSFDDRMPGDRSTRTAPCDALDEGRCLLPFPSSAFMVEDANSPTGRRVRIEDSSLPGAGDDEAGFINLMDGFSRLSPVLSTFEGGLDPALTAGRMHGPAHESSPVHLVNAEPGHPDYGTEVPVWLEIVDDGFEGGTDLLIAFPTVPMAENAEYVVFITDEVLDSSGQPVVADRMADVALGRAAPSSEAEARIASHHAPARALLAERTELDAERVVRVWDFSTRTTLDVTRRLDSMMADAVGAMDAVEVELLTFTPREDPSITAIIKGELRGVPDFLTEARRFEFDSEGLPVAQGTRTTSFRVTLPAEGFDGPGTDYRVALYGHGTGGDVNDNSFDAEIAAEGVVKVNLEFHGWTGDDLVYTFVDLLTLMRGSEQSTSQLLQAVVDGYALLKALEGELGQQLRGETIAGEPNPLAGTGPITEDPAWVGGSLGGTMGAIISAAYPEIDKAVLNVPAGAWTHLVADSYMYTGALRGILSEAYGTEIDARFAMAIMQTSWDDVDGAAWADRARADGVKLLLQQSMDDPVVPNQGTDLLAAALQAKHVGPALRPIAAVDAAEDDLVIDGVGITQYRVPDEGPFQVHGFAARNTPAGLAAMEQIFGFMRSGWAGEARIHFPDGYADVTEDGSCDFSDHW